jgi:hypothetical protein
MINSATITKIFLRVFIEWCFGFNERNVIAQPEAIGYFHGYSLGQTALEAAEPHIAKARFHSVTVVALVGVPSADPLIIAERTVSGIESIAPARSALGQSDWANRLSEILRPLRDEKTEPCLDNANTNPK